MWLAVKTAIVDPAARSSRSSVASSALAIPCRRWLGSTFMLLHQVERPTDTLRAQPTGLPSTVATYCRSGDPGSRCSGNICRDRVTLCNASAAWGCQHARDDRRGSELWDRL